MGFGPFLLALPLAAALRPSLYFTGICADTTSARGVCIPYANTELQAHRILTPSISQLRFRVGAPRARTGGFALEPGECLVLRAFGGDPGENWPRASDRDTLTRRTPELGALIRWNTSDGELPTRRQRGPCRRFLRWERRLRPQRAPKSPAPRLLQWLQTEPQALSCNFSGASSDSDWASFNRRLRIWKSSEHFGAAGLPLVPDTLLAEALNRGQGLEELLWDLLSGKHFSAHWWAFQARRCILGVVCAALVTVLAGVQRGKRLEDVASLLFAVTFQQGMWVPLDGSLWPITAADVAHVLELHQRTRPRPWRSCPCPPEAPHEGLRPLRLLRSLPARITLVGGHHYVFDVALGLADAAETAAMHTPTMQLLGYELAGHMAQYAANCELLPNFCQQDAIQQLSRRLCERNEEQTAHHANLAAQPGDAMSLAEARAEMRSVYAQSTWLQQADVIICAFPYLLAFLLWEVVGTKPLLVVWQGGHLMEYLDESLHPWGQQKLKALLAARSFLVMNHLDHVWLQRTVGLAALLPFGARYFTAAARKATGLAPGELHANVRSRRVLLHRLHFTLWEPEMLLFESFLTRGEALGTTEVMPAQRSFESWELLNFKGIVLVPWNLELTTFVELYRLAVPLFVPDENFMTSVVWRYIMNPEMHSVHRFTTIRREWWQGAACHLQCPDNTTRTPFPLPGLAPWLDLARKVPLNQQIRQWWRQTDYMTMPSVQRFAGAAELLVKLQDLEPEKVVASMSARNALDLRRSREIYEALLA